LSRRVAGRPIEREDPTPALEELVEELADELADEPPAIPSAVAEPAGALSRFKLRVRP
jgi:hypothetical protein